MEIFRTGRKESEVWHMGPSCLSLRGRIHLGNALADGIKEMVNNMTSHSRISILSWVWIKHSLFNALLFKDSWCLTVANA